MSNRFGISDDVIEAVRKVLAGEKMDPVGKADADIDNDGDVDKSDSYLHNRRKAIKKAMKKEEVEQVDEAPYTHRAATFNGNVVKGTGSTKEAARKDAEKKAKALGSTIRKQLPTKEEVEQTDEGAMSRMDVQTKEKERLGSDKVRGSGLKTFKKKDEVDVKPKMAEASELPKKVIMKGHEIAKKLIKMKSKVDEPYAVGMATAKKKYGID